MSLPPPSPKQARIIWAALTGLSVAAIVGLVVGFIWGAGRVLNIMAPVLWPLAVAGVLAYLLDPVVDWLQRRKMSRRSAIISVFAIALLLFGLLLGSVVPQLVKETRDLARKIPGYVEKAQRTVEAYINDPPQWAHRFLNRDETAATPSDTKAIASGETNISGEMAASTTNTWAEAAPVRQSQTNTIANLAGQINAGTLQSAGNWAAFAAPKVGRWLLGQVGRVASWFGVLAALALIPVYAFYLLAEKTGIQSNWTNYLPLGNSRLKDELVFVLDSANNYMIAFFRGQVLVAICDGIMYAIGFTLIGLPYAILLGVMAVFLTLIPFLGAIVTCAAALLLALVQFGDWLHPLLVMAVFAVVQGIEGFVVAPKILGERVGLHPLTIIIAVMAGTTLLGGILGGILAIPLTALLRVLMARYVWKRDLRAEA
jgi:predicted PurR-regulated permease PerM